MKLEDLYRIRLELNGVKVTPAKEEMIEPNPCWEGYEAIGLKPDGSPNCVPIKDEMGKVKKEGFPIPSPSGDEDEDTFIKRCMSEIGGEYDQDQALAICYKKYEEK
jgi:hypothetical protein